MSKNAAVEAIEASGLFDAAFYKKHYGVAQDGLAHYLARGGGPRAGIFDGPLPERLPGCGRRGHLPLGTLCRLWEREPHRAKYVELGVAVLALEAPQAVLVPRLRP